MKFSYKRKQIQGLLLIIIAIITTSCEDKIDITLDEGTPQLAVDAFLTDKPGAQIVKLRKTSPYFDNTSSPAVVGAVVTVADNLGHTYNFFDSNNTGDYTYTPTLADTFARIGAEYTLSINYNGENFMASSALFPVPPIDSLNYKFQEAVGPQKAGYTTAFYATDIPILINFYWIRSYKNGVLNKKPSSILLAQDGAFGGSGADGFIFILPIREGINDSDNPFQLNDSVTVEVHSVNPETYFFLQEVQTQSTNAGLFATPPANVSTNILNTNPSSKTKAVGFFNMAAVSTGGIRIK